MLPNQVNSPLIGHPGMQPGMMPQQHPPNQVDTAQSIPGLSNPEHGRMWQQIQHNQRIAQLQQQVGREIGGGGPMNQQVSTPPARLPRFPLSTSPACTPCVLARPAPPRRGAFPPIYTAIRLHFCPHFDPIRTGHPPARYSGYSPAYVIVRDGCLDRRLSFFSSL